MNLLKLTCRHKAIYTSYFQLKNFNSCVPKQPFEYGDTTNFNENTSDNNITIDLLTISHLEKLSLVNFGNSRGIDILVSSIKFAERLLAKNTSGLKPLTTVLENRILPLRPDTVEDGNCSESIIVNAKLIEEEYFVAPPGNIPVDFKSNVLKDTKP